MTATAVGSELTIVYVIGQVTICTSVTRFAHRIQRAAMTAIASDLNMSAMQFEIGLQVVVEQP